MDSWRACAHLRSEEKRAATNAVDQKSAGDGDKQRENLVASIQTQLVGLTRDTGTAVDDSSVVTDEGIARPLGEEAERDDH